MCFPFLNGHKDDKHGGKPIEMVVKPHFPLEHCSIGVKIISFLNVYQHGIYPHQKNTYEDIH